MKLWSANIKLGYTRHASKVAATWAAPAPAPASAASRSKGNRLLGVCVMWATLTNTHRERERKLPAFAKDSGKTISSSSSAGGRSAKRSKGKALNNAACRWQAAPYWENGCRPPAVHSTHFGVSHGGCACASSKVFSLSNYTRVQQATQRGAGGTGERETETFVPLTF